MNLIVNLNFFSYSKAESSTASAFGGFSVLNENVIKHFSEVKAALQSTMEGTMLGKSFPNALIKVSKSYFHYSFALVFQPPHQEHSSLHQTENILHLKVA